LDEQLRPGYKPRVTEPQAIDAVAAAALGALQGVAEFLPISSSGHLALGQAWLGIEAEAGGHTLSVILHAGTLLAVLVHYRVALTEIALGFLRNKDDGRSRKMVAALFVGTLPLALALIPAVKAAIVAIEGDVRAIGFALLLTSAALAFSHRKHPPSEDPGLPPRLDHAFVIGLAQLLAITPGISRSGSTIAAALALGLGRARAAQFSFLLSIPAICGATLDELRHWGEVSVNSSALGVGFIVSFLVGLASLGALLRVIARVGLLPFVPYLLIVGGLAVAIGAG
jgi:undecaprenyl-diphosphatase